MIRFLLFAAILSLNSLLSAAQTPDGLTLFKRVQATYRSARSYQDAGKVSTVLIQKTPSSSHKSFIRSLCDRVSDYLTGTYTDERTFQTAFVRATNQFWFHYDKSERLRAEQYTILADGQQVWSRKTIAPEPRRFYLENSLASALGTATGVSRTASRKIPGLLLSDPIEAGWNIGSITDWHRLADTVQAGHACYRIQGTEGKHHRTTLFIDKKTLLIRRIEEVDNVPPTTFFMSMVYEPRLNQPVPRSRFDKQTAQ